MRTSRKLFCISTISRYHTCNRLEERQISTEVVFVVISYPDFEDIIGRSAVVEEELQTVGPGFGEKPLSFQRCFVTRLNRGCAKVHEVAFF